LNTPPPGSFDGEKSCCYRLLSRVADMCFFLSSGLFWGIIACFWLEIFHKSVWSLFGQFILLHIHPLICSFSLEWECLKGVHNRSSPRQDHKLLLKLDSQTPCQTPPLHSSHNHVHKFSSEHPHPPTYQAHYPLPPSTS